jgi:hypothetical protein
MPGPDYGPAGRLAIRNPEEAGHPKARMAGPLGWVIWRFLICVPVSAVPLVKMTLWPGVSRQLPRP